MPKLASRQSAFIVLFLLCISVSFSNTGVHALPATTEFTLNGLVASPGTYNLADLQASTPTTQQVSFQSGSGTTSGSFTGVPLYSFLNTSPGGGGILTDPSVKNDILRDYVKVTGSDGYRVLVSLGEIHPNFGHQQDLIAYAFNGQPLGDNGFARTTAPGDIAGGRYVSNVADLQVLSATPASQRSGTGGGLSSQFSLSGQISHPGTYTLSSLQALPSLTETATFKAGQATVTGTFTGVPLWTLITSAGMITDPAVKNDVLGKYLVATGSDGYKAVIALGEIAPQFGNQPVLVAYGMNGGGLGQDGFARLVLPGDTFGGRYVSNLVGLEVLNASAAVPEPSTLLLMSSGLLAAWSLRRRVRSA